MKTRPYKASADDLAYEAAVRADAHEFDIAKLMQSVSDEYLAVMAHDNSGPTAAPYMAMINFEQQRRNISAAKRANKIAVWSVAISIASLIISVCAILYG